MKSNSTKDRLISEAIRLFYRKGFNNSSIRDIVKAAGVTNSTLYNHFRDKDHLLYEIIFNVGNAYIEELDKIQSRYDHPLDRLKHLIAQHTCLIKERKEEIKIFLDEEYQLSPKYRKKTLEQQRVIYDFFMKQLSELEEMGLLRPVNKTVANFCVFAIINWSYRWFKEGGKLTIEEIANHLMNVYFQGVLERLPENRGGT